AETKRRLLNIIIEEIRCVVKKRERKGDIVYKLRGDGSIKKEWEEAKKREDPKPPSSGDSSLQVAWLRERFENSNFTMVKIPIEIHNLGHGEKLTCMDSGRLPAELGLADHDILSLSERGLIRPRPQKPHQKNRIDHTALRQTYHKMLNDGGFSSQAALARHLGVSRVWVSRVLKGIRKKAG
ncbi:MAG: hypothetical protein WBH56_12680, partial [Bacteroidota bacterium]